ncbi:MAG: dihydropteroate synthase [Flavobacteriales bacterium]|nr:dihydropteroate synthase [Flavobacteriales bacterium]
MGILNITTDSFYDGGKYIDNDKIISRCRIMLEEGASIIDIGAQSSKPGSSQISSEEELIKLIPTIKLLKNTFKDIILSIDTFWANTAKKCVSVGADIINDISAGEIDDAMFSTIAELNVPYIIMHMKGTPKNMQKNPSYNDVTKEIVSYFREKISKLNKLGFYKIIIDPGFGFGKTIQHNYQLLNNLNDLTHLKLPILIGVSRKSMIYNLLGTTPQKALNGTSVINTIALQNGANILRVHDVKEAYECIKITTFAKKKL